jgi:hypothetical protein
VKFVTKLGEYRDIGESGCGIPGDQDIRKAKEKNFEPDILIF